MQDNSGLDFVNSLASSSLTLHQTRGQWSCLRTGSVVRKIGRLSSVGCGQSGGPGMTDAMAKYQLTSPYDKFVSCVTTRKEAFVHFQLVPVALKPVLMSI